MENKLAYYEVFDLFEINAVSTTFRIQRSIFRFLLLNYEKLKKEAVSLIAIVIHY